MNGIIINLAPTGMVPTRAMTPHVPISPEEIVRDVLECLELGPGIIHLHARDERGEPTWRKEVYAEIIHGIRRRRQDIIICVSTSGRLHGELAQRADVLDLDGPLKPDMASLTLGSLNFARSASVNSPQMIVSLLERMNERGIKPELEIFDLGMINFGHYLIRKGLLKPPYYFNILLGNIATAQATLHAIGLMISELPQPCVWALAGIGDSQRKVTSMAVAMGASIRIGLEDNIYFDETRSRLATNAMLLERAAAIAAAAGVAIASADEIRAGLELPPAGRRPALSDAGRRTAMV
jgi:uncharacterized protein (DUF849 family)